VIADVATRVLTDPGWPQLAAAVLLILGLASITLAYTAWSRRT
jgi:hypothetical protein